MWLAVRIPSKSNKHRRRKPAAYTIERRVLGSEVVGDHWGAVATAIETEATLVDQTRGPELEYRIIAVNKAGEGPPSNTVMVVL